MQNSGFPHGAEFAVIPHAMGITLCLYDMTAPGIFSGNNILQVMNVVRSDDEIDNRHPFNQFSLIFLGHAACNAKKHTGIFVFQFLDFPDFTIHLFFRVLPDGAGIHNHNICILHVFRRLVSQILQLSIDTFCIIFVHLTAIGNGIVVFFICEPLFFHDFPPVMNA